MAELSYNKVCPNKPREAWLEARVKGIGGSDCAAACGASRYKSRLQLWAEKSGADVQQTKETVAMRIGVALEDLCAEFFEEATKKKTRKVNYLLQSKKYPFMLATIDRRVVGENAILECKTASHFTGQDYAKGIVPPEYLLQCYHYQIVTGADVAYLAVINNGRTDIPPFAIKRDEEMIELIIQKELEFWKMVQEGTPPPPDGSDSATDFLRKLYPEVQPDTFQDLSGIVSIEDIKLFNQLKEANKQNETKMNTIKQLILMNMKDAKLAYVNGIEVAKRTLTKGSKKVNVPKLKEIAPEIYENCLEETDGYVTLTVKNVEEMEVKVNG